MLKKISMMVAVSAFAALSSIAQAVPISGLNNTGTGFANNTQDTNYALSVISGSTVTGPYGYVADNVGFPDGSPWISSGGASKWLTPTADEAASFDPTTNGIYRWRLTFNLASVFDPATAFFNARWATDNNGVAMLNGNLITGSGSSGFGSWSSFTANDFFVTGTNYLDFVVTNLRQSSGNPTGLRVEFTNSNVPEPGTLALLGLAMAGLGLRRRKAG